MFFSHFMLFPTFLEKQNNYFSFNVFFRGGGGGGGGVLIFFFFRKTILSHFTFYAIFNIKKKILSLTG